MKFSTLTAAAAVLALSASSGFAGPKWHTLVQFDDAPEGLVADGSGGLFVSLFHTGRIMRVDKDGKATEIANLRSVVGEANGSAIGLDWDGKDSLYVAFSEHSKRYPWPADQGVVREACGDSNVRTTGLYKVTISSGKVEPVATRAEGYPFCYLDDPAIAKDGSVFVSDLSFSGIWRIDPAAREATMWSKDALLDPGPKPLSGFAVGVNGIAVSPKGDAVYGVTGGNPMIVRIPLDTDGTAGPAEKVAFGYDDMDGLEIDADGNFYVTEALRHEVWKISPDIRHRQQLGNPIDAPLGSPASIAFLGEEVCVTNLNFFGNLTPDKANTIVCAGGIEKKW